MQYSKIKNSDKKNDNFNAKFFNKNCCRLLLEKNSYSFVIKTKSSNNIETSKIYYSHDPAISTPVSCAVFSKISISALVKIIFFNFKKDSA